MSRADQKLEQIKRIVREVGLRLSKRGYFNELVETTKWGQAAFLPDKPRVGTTVRVDLADDHHVALYVHCQTNLVEMYKTVYPELRYEGNRAVWFPVNAKLPKQAVAFLAEAALMYHHNKTAVPR